MCLNCLLCSANPLEAKKEKSLNMSATAGGGGGGGVPEEDKKPTDQSAHINLKVKGQVCSSCFRLIWGF